MSRDPFPIKHRSILFVCCCYCFVHLLGFFFTMNILVLTKLEAKPESFPTYITHIGLLPSMHSLVYNTVRTKAEAFATLNTSERFFPSMASLVSN